MFDAYNTKQMLSQNMCTLHVIKGDLNKQDLRSTYNLYIFPYFYKPYLVLIIMYPGNSIRSHPLLLGSCTHTTKDIAACKVEFQPFN